MMLRLCFALLAFLWSALLETEDPPDPPDPPPDPPADDQPYRLFKTQQEYEDAFGPTRIEGRTSGVSEEHGRWLSELGVKDEAEAKTLIEKQREAVRNNESEVERITREANEARQRADALQAERDQERELRHESIRRHGVQRALREKKVRDDRVDDATEYVLRSADISAGLTLDDQERLAGQDEAAEAAKSKYPEWFGEKSQQDDTVDPNKGDRGDSGGKDKKDKPSGRWIQRRLGARR